MGLFEPGASVLRAEAHAKLAGRLLLHTVKGGVVNDGAQGLLLLNDQLGIHEAYWGVGPRRNNSSVCGTSRNSWLSFGLGFRPASASPALASPSHDDDELMAARRWGSDRGAQPPMSSMSADGVAGAEGGTATLL